jgi:hypothetical protein
MERVRMALKGVTTTSTYEDGEMYSLVNLRRKGGALHPVMRHAVEAEIDGEYGIYFIHKNEDWEHWIGVRNDADSGTFGAFWDICDGAKEIASGVAGVVNAVEQSGNLLIFIADDAMYFALFRDGGYTWYGLLPDLIPLEWGCYEEVIDTGAANISTEGNPVIPVPRYNRDGDLEDASGTYPFGKALDYSDEDKNARLVEQINAVLNERHRKMNQSYNANLETTFRGLFYDCFFVRWAYRLYDGTCVKLSPPILVCPQSALLDFGRLSITFYVKQLAYTIDIFSAPAQLVSGWLAVDLTVKGFVPGVRYDTSVLEPYRELIKSVDVFMSPMTGAVAMRDVRDFGTGVQPVTVPDHLDPMASLGNNPIPYMYAAPGTIRLQNGLHTDAVKDMEQFYFVKELKVGDTTNEAFVRFPEKNDMDAIRRIDALVHQERLKDDTQTVQQFGAKKSYSYNGRLHLADTRTVYFDGFAFPFL